MHFSLLDRMRMVLVPGVIAGLTIIGSTVTAMAQDPSADSPAFTTGAIAATGFAGIKLQTESLKPGIDPTTKTVINTDGVTLRLFDGSTLGGPMSGQEAVPSAIEFQARDIGHVFGLAFDGRPAVGTTAPALYAAATAAFGLHISGPDKDGDGKPDRLLKGAAGAAFMEGLFGRDGGGPGTIWKIDQASGKLSRFADVGGDKNGGPGLGALAIDTASGTLYVPDLDTGLIHRFKIQLAPADLGPFDHGVTARPAVGKTAINDDGKRLDITSVAFDTTDPATWGTTQRERRVDAVAVHQSRLYYSVAEGPEIWSVGLEADGAFKGDPRFELSIRSDQPFPVTTIVFDSTGRMIVAERGTVQNPANFSGFAAAGPSRVLRFAPETPDDPATPSLWLAELEEYAIGNAKGHRDSSGGVAIQHAYNADGTIEAATCGGTLIASASALGPQSTSHGLQLNAIDAVRTGDALPPEHAYINLEPNLDDAQARGFSGGVAVLQDCSGGGLPPVAGPGSFPAVTGDGASLPAVSDGGGGFAFPPVTDDAGTVDPAGGGKALLTVTKTASVDKCSPKGGCAFNIEVQNDTAIEIAGPIVIDEQIDAPQATLTGEPNAPWTCTKAAPFTCTHPGPLPAASKLDMRVVFAPNTAAEIKTVRNCAVLNGTLPTAADAAAPNCATIPLDLNAPAQQGPLIISKKGAGPCTAKGPCAFTITVTNTVANLPGPFVINELIDAPQATLVGEPNAPWTCTKAAPFTCTHPGPLPANAPTELTLSFAPNTPPEKTELKNCAIPVTGVGGKAVPGQKTDLFDFRRYRPLIKPATYRPQSFPLSDGLLHLTGGAGGNIGGQTNKCLEWQTANRGFVVNQANGFNVSFSDMTIEGGRITGGNASYITSAGAKGGKIIGGNVFGLATDGSFAGAMAFRVRWNDGSEAVYNIRLDAQGRATGNTTDAKNNSAALTADSKWFKCARNEVCDRYSNDASETAKKFNKLSCGPDDPPGRWSNDVSSHLAWCMGQPPSSTFLNSETVARTGGLAACEAQRATFCDGYVADTLVLAKDFEARKCTEPHAGYMNTDPAAQQKFCLEESRGNLDSSAQSRKILLDSCISRLAAAAGGNPGGGQPGDGGVGAGGNGAATEPTPEQCAVVPIQPDADQADGGNAGQTPGDVVQGAPADQGNGLTIQKQAVGTNCSKNKSCDFAITITGAGPGAAGPITVVDTIDALATHDLASDALLSATPANPWSCAKGHPLRCTHPGPVPAGGLVLNLGMKPGANATSPSMRNCAAVETAPPTAVPVPTGTDTNGTKFEVIPPASCAPGANCAWQLKVTNTSVQSRTGSLIWSGALASASGNAAVPASKVTVGTVIATPRPTCIGRDGDPSRQVDCTLGEVTLAPNASYTATMNLQAETAANAAGPLQASMNGSFTTLEGQMTGRANAAAPVAAPAVVEAAPEPSCATIPVLPVTVQPPPPEPAADPNGLVLVKRRSVDKCSDLGGGCAFTVSITNSSAAEFNGPIEFTDILKTADGQSLPNATLEAQPLLTLAEGSVAAISCSKTGEIVTCGTGGANAIIPAGKTIVAQLTMKPGAAGGATAVRNCAVLKSGGGDSCSNITLINGPLVRLTKFGGGDTCVPKCTFAVVVQNVGNTDAKGSFKFKDVFTPASSLAGFNSVPDNADCAFSQGSLFCVPKLTVLKPGELTTVTVTVFGSAKAPEYKNCVEFVPQPQAPASSLVLDNSNDGRCVTVRDTSPQTPNLVITKRPPNTNGGADGHCDLKSACRFTIDIRNNGLAPFTAPLRITDTVSLGVPQFISIGPGSPQSLPWTCSKVQNAAGLPIAQSSITCELPALPNGLAPGTTATLEVAVTAGATWKGSDRLTNCAEIVSDGELGANAIKKDCASVVLDPFNVKVAKTGDQACPPGSNCTFKITLFNPGPIPHNAPVTIVDGLVPQVSAQIVAITPPLPCAAQPTTIPFSCTSPGPVRLDLDAAAGSEFGPREYTMVIKMPNDGSAEAYRNCISVRAGNGETSEEACHTVSTKPVAPVEAPATCAGGMVLTEGACACPPNMRWNGRECIGTGGINGTPAPVDTVTSPASPPATPPVAATCAGGMVLTEGACACPQFMRWNGSKCVGTGGINTTPLPNDPSDDVAIPRPRPTKTPTIECPRNADLRNGSCVCRDGFEQVRRVCRPIREQAPPPKQERKQCPADRPVGEFPRCCPQNAQFRGGQCRCLPGLQFRRGQCVAAQQPRPQPESCPQGQVFINGQCRRLAVPTPQPKPPNRNCGPGYRPLEKPNKYGAFCEPIPSQQKCPAGWTGTAPNCQPPKVVYPPCPPGWSGPPGNCKPPVARPAPSAPTPQRCGNGFSGFKPNCTCSGRKEVVNGQCIDKIQ